MSNQKSFGTWRVRFIDTISNGEVQTILITGYYNYDAVVEFFGLKNPDVSWYEVELVLDEDNN